MVVTYGFNQRQARVAPAETKQVIPIRPVLQYFDPAGLIARINAQLTDNEERLELEEFESRDPKQNPFLYKVTGIKPSLRGKFPITQTGNYGLLSLLNIETERSAGYFFIEQGILDDNGSNSPVYETLKLRIKRQLEIKGGVIIPEGIVRIYVQSDDCNLELKRVNSREDLPTRLPTNWFLTPAGVQGLT